VPGDGLAAGVLLMLLVPDIAGEGVPPVMLMPLMADEGDADAGLILCRSNIELRGLSWGYAAW